MPSAKSDSRRSGRAPVPQAAASTHHVAVTMAGGRALNPRTANSSETSRGDSIFPFRCRGARRRRPRRAACSAASHSGVTLDTDPTALDLLADSALSRDCARPQFVSGQWIRCGTGDAEKCRSCARLFRDDWRAIGLSGYSETMAYYWVTLTIGSFGDVHHVPLSKNTPKRRCACGRYHLMSDADLRGVPVDFDNYDYEGQLNANRDAAKLWNNSLAKLHRAFEFEHLVAKEIQARGAIHFHAVLAAGPSLPMTGEDVIALLRSVTSVSAVTGQVQVWGNVDVRELAPSERQLDDGTTATVIEYAIKSVITYALKTQGAASKTRSPLQWTHRRILDERAAVTPCSPTCKLHVCDAVVHRTLLIRRQPVGVSRGWSVGERKTRASLRAARAAWAEEHPELVGRGASDESARRAKWAAQWEKARRDFPDSPTRWPMPSTFKSDPES